jgi:hypothetical protein
VKRFVLAEAIARYAQQLSVEPDPRLRDVLYEMLAQARREWTASVADYSGVHFGPAPAGRRAAHANGQRRSFNDAFQQSAHALLLIEPGPGLHIVDMNDACAAATLADRRAVAGQKIFEAFPDNPSDATADGVANLFAVMRAAAQTGRPMDLLSQPYDVRDSEGRFVRKVWRSRTIPTFDEDGRLAYLLNHVEEIDQGARQRPGRIATVPVGQEDSALKRIN